PPAPTVKVMVGGCPSTPREAVFALIGFPGLPAASVPATENVTCCWPPVGTIVVGRLDGMIENVQFIVVPDAATHVGGPVSLRVPPTIRVTELGSKPLPESVIAATAVRGVD